MKALVKTRPEPGLWLEDVQVPEFGPQDVLIRVTKTSVCGTDLHIVDWDEWAQATIETPMPIGHEFVGVIDSMGDLVEGLSVDQRVSAEGHVTCGHCRNCRAGRRRYCRNTSSVGVNRPGAFAEFVTIPATNVFPMPDSISDDIACILDPLGNATHTALAFDLVGEDVLITGAGPIGVMSVAIARHIGARYIAVTDINDFRLDIASEMGADAVINATVATAVDAMAELGMTEGFDVGFEMSGNFRALHDMITAMNHGGNIALLGIPPSETEPIDWTDIIFRGLTLRGIYGRRVFETWYKMTSMLQTGLDVSAVITHHFDAAQFENAFEVIRSGQCGKVILNWETI
ncbi:MAG: L-threonine 3-dehydrogenase [Acidobacteria bacterium]|nr:L-threonine 3-dehydrogenase [Acidobacteriota bacterium]